MKLLIIKLLLLSICITSFSQVKIEEDSIQIEDGIIAGKQNGIRVRVLMSVPIQFKLE